MAARSFPPTSRWGRPGFVDILEEIGRVWREERSRIAESAEAMTAQLRGVEQAGPTVSVPGPGALERTAKQFLASFDARHGGFGDAPKFPRPSELLFLLREHARTGNSDLREVALRTLRAMALGGMRDHIGGGFHRYSVDAAWRVPHFEKMLYDQAQLVLAYAEAAQASGDPFYAEVAEDTLQYVQREMTDRDGGFYSAEDADSVPPERTGEASPHKSEGAFYLWTTDETDALLGADAGIVKMRFGMTATGNAPSDPQQEFTGKNLLYVAQSVEDLATSSGRTGAEVAGILNGARLRMFEHRLARPRPQRDDKILTSWNGLMIAAFARMARVIRRAPGGTGADPAAAAYLETARRAAGFLRGRMWQADSRTLLRRYRDGHAEIDGYAEDYACLVAGLLELFQADPDPVWLEWAVALQTRQDELFWDETNAGWFSTTGRDPSVLVRMKDDYDGAEPTASSLSVHNLLSLSHLVANDAWPVRIERTLMLFGTRLEQMGRAVPMMAAALSAYVAGIQQIVVLEGEEPNDAVERFVGARYLPFAITLWLAPASQRRLAALLPFAGAMRPVGRQTTVHVCRDFACRQPSTSVAELENQLP